MWCFYGFVLLICFCLVVYFIWLVFVFDLFIFVCLLVCVVCLLVIECGLFVSLYNSVVYVCILQFDLVLCFKGGVQFIDCCFDLCLIGLRQMVFDAVFCFACSLTFIWLYYFWLMQLCCLFVCCLVIALVLLYLCCYVLLLWIDGFVFDALFFCCFAFGLFYVCCVLSYQIVRLVVVYLCFVGLGLVVCVGQDCLCCYFICCVVQPCLVFELLFVRFGFVLDTFVLTAVCVV